MSCCLHGVRSDFAGLLGVFCQHPTLEPPPSKKKLSYGKYIMFIAFFTLAIYSMTCVILQDIQELIEHFV
jgi:hypothetical protein